MTWRVPCSAPCHFCLSFIDSYTYYKSGLDAIAARLGERMRNLGMTVSIVEQK